MKGDKLLIFVLIGLALALIGAMSVSATCDGHNDCGQHYTMPSCGSWGSGCGGGYYYNYMPAVYYRPVYNYNWYRPTYYYPNYYSGFYSLYPRYYGGYNGGYYGGYGNYYGGYGGSYNRWWW
jgi:hypothetical protein